MQICAALNRFNTARLQNEETERARQFDGTVGLVARVRHSDGRLVNDFSDLLLAAAGTETLNLNRWLFL